MLNTEIGRIKTYQKLPDLFHNGEFIKNERHKLDILCQHFANPDLPQPQQPNTPPHHPDIPEGELLTNIRISAEEVKRAIINIKANKPSGCDGIPPKFFRICAESISLPLSMLYNELMEAEMIPSAMKETIIYPLYKKKGAKNCVKNYRPISILPATSKILEKIIYDRIHMYTDKYDKLCNEQHGYRSKRSTLSATLVLTDAIREAGEQRQMTGVALIDFEKAFESLAYPILLNKLQQLGITGKVFQWFKSYFEERTITVQRGKHKSAPIRLLRGTPTGSSLSGLIFSCYINDFQKYSNTANASYMQMTPVSTTQETTSKRSKIN
ncbi:RNA-directed DNA polymerase from mobile element jockey [Folsomia candida]|uniref:RNA-directed DNA polymerase from mobile element jockey n=1 Tax=Folsomia candida TaxID=158441 RepID=A0A226E9H8_FOLCA|nr:RNA-directed DNA polymerase from mobile element jockey [Folsomia candida]